MGNRLSKASSSVRDKSCSHCRKPHKQTKLNNCHTHVEGLSTFNFQSKATEPLLIRTTGSHVQTQAILLQKYDFLRKRDRRVTLEGQHQTSLDIHPFYFLTHRVRESLWTLWQDGSVDSLMSCWQDLSPASFMTHREFVLHQYV